MFNVGAGELVVILVAALIVLGPQRLPEFARAIGKFMREFRRQTDEVRTVVEREFYKMDQEFIDEPRPPVPLGTPPALPSMTPTAPLITPSALPEPQSVELTGPVPKTVPVETFSAPPEPPSTELAPVPGGVAHDVPKNG